MKERGVADELITALMNRGAEIQAQAGQGQAKHGQGVGEQIFAVPDAVAGEQRLCRFRHPYLR